MKVDGASALVAGGASGLGAATARALHGAGASVVVADLNAEKGNTLVGELGERARFVEVNVTDADQVSAAVDAAAEADGGLRISVCCAGIGWAQRTASKDGPHDLQLFSNVVQVNLIGTFNVLRLAAASMNGNEPDDGGERGVCVNTASIAAFDGQIGQVAYSASKGGIVGLTLPAARDMASRGIRVVTIAPGLFDTPLLGALPAGGARCPRRHDAVPVTPRRARRVRGARPPHRREPDAERRDDQARRRPADGAALDGPRRLARYSASRRQAPGVVATGAQNGLKEAGS